MRDLTPGADAELVQRARSGDRAAFGEIVQTYQAPALPLATIIGGDSTEAYDIVQEAFVRAFQALPSMRSGESLRPWLLRIVANQAKNSRRSRWRRDRRQDRHAALRPDDVSGPDEIALGEVAAQGLLVALSKLSVNDRTVLACRYFADMSESETASALGVANGTVKSRTARALAHLRDGLATGRDLEPEDTP